MSEIDWLNPAAPVAKPVPTGRRHLEIVDGPLPRQPAPPVRQPDIRPAKPEPNSVPLENAWAVGFWAEHPEWGPQLSDVQVLTWQELKAKGWHGATVEGRLVIDLAMIGHNLSAEPADSPRNRLPTAQKVWGWFAMSHPLQDYLAAARAFSRIDGLSWLRDMAKWAEGTG